MRNPDPTLRHLTTLCRHRATLRASNGKSEPLTRAFYNNALFECATKGYSAIVYDMVLPEVAEKTQLVIWRNGHMDSGSVKNIEALLKARESV
jgi:hypothetical protein